MIYATRDADGSRIEKNAHIATFETIEAAREWLIEPYRDGGWDMDSIEIGSGHYSDAWIKTHSEPRAEDGTLIAGLCDFTPFAPEQLYVAAPGQHPGGRQWWITPVADVLTLAEIKPLED